jgi:hypothetical protein
MGCCSGYVHFLAIRSGLADELRKAGTQHSRVSSVTDTGEIGVPHRCVGAMAAEAVSGGFDRAEKSQFN